MTITEVHRSELCDAGNEAIAEAVAYADPMVLRGLLYQLTGDEQIAATRVKTGRVGFFEVPTPAADELTALLQQRAVEFLEAYRDAGAGLIDIGPAERLQASLSLAVGAELQANDMTFWLEELALNPWARSLEWRTEPPVERLLDFSVTVIGAGMAGLNAALQLKRAGISYTVIEKNSGVGGTWHEARYPGIRVDSPSRAYTNIFGVDFGYPYAYCPGAENQRYFDWVADSFDLRRDIVFDTEVLSLSWDESSSTWSIQVEGPDGKRTLRSNAVITAVGFLNRPRIPTIDSMTDFRGRSWHPARWPEDCDPRGKRFAIVGTGASGYQLTPELALEAEHVVLFQRTPQWLFEVPGYRAPLPPEVGWLDRNFPYYSNFMRFRAFHAMTSFTELAEIDFDFAHPHARSVVNKRAWDACIATLDRKLVDPTLVEKMTPAHPPFSARPIMIDPEYSVLDAIQRDNVTLVTEGIRRITATGIETDAGTQHNVDVIVYATGFHATEYLFPMQVTGCGDVTLDEFWREDGARAYLTSMVPGFPNLWMVYGPNSNAGLPPAAFQELVALYALQCIERLVLEGKKSIQAKEEAYWRFSEEVDRRNKRKVWSDPRAHNYYWTEHGRSATMGPFSSPEMWHMLRHPNFEELDVR